MPKDNTEETISLDEAITLINNAEKQGDANTANVDMTMIAKLVDEVDAATGYCDGVLRPC